jgi:hypothetical protein
VASSGVTESYLLLGLRLGRHVDGLVDAYYGPGELATRVEAEPLREPAALVEEAERLLAELEDGWLRDQVLGLRTYAGVIAGEELSYSDEVEGCYRVRPQRVSTDVYAAAHEELEALLPGAGPLAQRYQAWRRDRLLPPERILPALRDATAVLRDRTRARLELPPGDDVELEEVRDEPWRAFNYYCGDLRSRIAVNVDLPTTGDDVIELAAHEGYPGHHIEHAVKEQRLVRDRDELEESIQLVPTPAALLSEGIAEIGRELVVDRDGIEQLEAILERHGSAEDLGESQAVRHARRPLRRVMLDAALLMHEDGGSADEAQAYFERWGLDAPEEAAHGVRFVSGRAWRAYAITYCAGGELCRAWVGGDVSRFVRLLTEHVRVGDLLAGVSSGS